MPEKIRDWRWRTPCRLTRTNGCISRSIAAVFYRHPQIARTTFSHSDDYVRTMSEDPTEAFAFFEESVELSRRFRALEALDVAAISWSPGLSRSDRARPAPCPAAGGEIRSHPDLELLAPVPLSAVCFRHRAKDNQAILRRVIARGRVYLSNATIPASSRCGRASSITERRKTTCGQSCPKYIAAADELNS